MRPPATELPDGFLDFLDRAAEFGAILRGEPFDPDDEESVERWNARMVVRADIATARLRARLAEHSADATARIPRVEYEDCLGEIAVLLTRIMTLIAKDERREGDG